MIWTFAFREAGLRSLRRVCKIRFEGMKRFFEISLVLLSLPIWLPVSLAVAGLILLIDGRPIFYRSARTGRAGAAFNLLKFRTMRENAGDESDDERITRLGRVLRRLSVDELPQLLQVLSGKMALVGPRPLPVAYLPHYPAAASRRHKVRPGLTGLAQVNGRNDLSWEEKFALDVWYVDHQSFLLDLKIVAQTLGVLFSGKGTKVAKSFLSEA